MSNKELITSGLIEAYVLGVCTSQEKASIEAMRLQYVDVNEAILQFETVLEKKFTDEAMPIPTQLDNKIVQSFSQLQINKTAEATPLPQAPIRKMNWYKPLAAAALLFLGASAIFNYTQYTTIKQQKNELTIAQQKNSNNLPASDFAVMTNRSITPVAMYGVGLHAICRCTMFWNKETGMAYIMVHHLPNAPQGRSYQLWAMVNGKAVNAGVVDAGIRNRFIAMPNIPDNATAFIVTLENANGSPTPTQQETYLAGKI
jgi:anti-sigma-K factor RskA